MLPDFHTFTKAAPDLVRRIRSGDREAYELFYRMEFHNLVHFTASYLHDSEKARDISQDTLIALWENRHALDPDKNIRSFVFTIARNKTLNELRRQKLFAPAAGIDEALELLQDGSAEECINALELSSLIERVWKSLPGKIGSTFAMSRDEGLKNREIAAREGITEKAVEYRIRTALKQFRKLFENNI